MYFTLISRSARAALIELTHLPALKQETSVDSSEPHDSVAGLEVP